jgi:hypothetical protein
MQKAQRNRRPKPKKIKLHAQKSLSVYHVEQYAWHSNHTKADRLQLLVEATSCAEAATLAGDNDGVHEIGLIQCLGPIVIRPPEFHNKP